MTDSALVPITITMKWVSGGILMPDDIEDYNLYLALIDNKPQLLDLDGDNGIHAFDGPNLKEPYETRMNFLAIIVEASPNEDGPNWSWLDSWLDTMSMTDVFEGLEDSLYQLAPKKSEQVIIQADLHFLASRDYWGNYDDWIEDIIVRRKASQ